MITFDTPFIWIIVCAIAAVILTGILYWHKSYNDLSKRMVVLLASLRCLALFFILILFLNVFFRKNIHSSSKPVVICAIDNSHSMTLVGDSSEVKKYFSESFPVINTELHKNFTAKNIHFGSKVSENDSITFTDNSTDISSVFSYVDNLYDKNEIDAAILYTDGINNSGTDPTVIAQIVPYPIFIVATGDTTSRADISITNIRYNKSAYMQGKCVFEVNTKAIGFNNTNVVMQITDNNQLLMTKNIYIDNNAYYSSFTVDFEPKNLGKHFYRFNILAPKTDRIPQNNEKTCVVNVIEGKKNLVMISNGANPDIGSIYSAAVQNDYININSFLFEEFDINSLKDNDILVLCNLPDASAKSKLLFDKINQLNLPYLSIVGTKTDIPAFNSLNKNIKITGKNKSFQDAYPVFNNNFTSFSSTEDNNEIYQIFSPLMSPFGDYELPPSSDVLFYQKIGNVSTKLPLIITSKDYSRRRVYIFGEGIWQWRIRNYASKENYFAFDELFNNIIYYLSLSETFKHFQVNINNEYYQGEKITVGAELYDDNYKLYNTPDIQLTIKDASNSEYPYYFTKTEDSKYTLDIDNFPAGQYTWKATSPTETTDGAFYISPSDPEHNDLQAKHNDLRKIAENTGGKFLLLDEADKLPDLIKNQVKQGKAFSFQQHKRPKDYLPLLLTILALLTAEWGIRRKYGMY